MRILIDTNILIYREDDVEISKELQELLQLFYKEKYQILVHPDSIKDINNDKDESRKQKILSKLNTYPLLKNPPRYTKDKEFISKIPNFTNLNSNDIIDLNILYALYKNAVCYIITEDKGIHSWANILNIESCYSISEALQIFKELTTTKENVFSPVPIELKPLSHLNLQDSFFDDLRNDYPGFNEWFKKKSEQGMEAYVYFNQDDSIGAFLMLKEEFDEWIGTHPKPIFKKKILKIATLKSSNKNYGKRLGELFLNISFNYAVKNDFDEIYLTHYVKENDYLIPLIEKFGFEKSEIVIKRDSKKEDEFIYFKTLKVKETVSPEILRTKFFPSFYDGYKNKKFIIPIQPKWHD